MFVNEYKTEVISQISKMREESLEHNQELSQSVSYMRRTFDQTLMPQFEVMREQCKRATDRTESIEKRVDTFFSKLLELENGKLGNEEYMRQHHDVCK
jgi:hypothetical protein